MRTKAELEKELETAKDLSPTARAARKVKQDAGAACREPALLQMPNHLWLSHHCKLYSVGRVQGDLECSNAV